jgi:hypothetical protein
MVVVVVIGGGGVAVVVVVVAAVRTLRKLCCRHSSPSPGYARERESRTRSGGKRAIDCDCW